ncbi:hypothetical protein PsYK624_072660 [Phanerochaete sordida]|uniref:Uncharacterized protein n=1 Tax=Phanerochaete sordida TaxID=48140 RepID=A0A9P3G8B1_9APHY|nr:hypothetical protein PsYK624_072660 [Phanerochaete sordida]
MPGLPAVPRPPFPSDEFRLSPNDVEKAVRRWRLDCLQVLGYLAFVLQDDYLPFDLDAATPASAREAVRYYILKAPKRGVYLNVPDYDLEQGSMTYYRELWLKYGVPFAYPWADSYSLLYDDAWDPFMPRNFAKVTNPFELGPEVFAVAAELGSRTAFLLHPDLHDAYDSRYFYDNYADARWKVNLRVYYANCPRTRGGDEADGLIGPSHRRMELASFEPYRANGPLVAEQMRAAGQSPSPPGSLGPSPAGDRDTESPRTNLEDRLGSEVGDATLAEDEEATPPLSQSPSATGHRSAHPPYEQFAYAARVIIEQACANDLLVSDDLIPDPFPAVSLGIDAEFMAASIAVVPPPTELCFVAHYMEGTEQSLGDLCATALRSGMPFRLMFSTEYGDRYSKDRTEELKALEAIPPSVPTWAAPFYGDLLTAPSHASAADYRDAYYRGVSYITSLPHYARLFAYGGLVWRLAAAHLSVASADHPIRRLLTRPSDAWALYRVGAELNASTRRYSENYAVAGQDPLVRTILGVFSNGQSFWPPQEIFLNSFRWWGQWSPTNETWFLQCFKRIEAGTERPKTVSAWHGSDFTRAPGDLRQPSM